MKLTIQEFLKRRQVEQGIKVVIKRRYDYRWRITEIKILELFYLTRVRTAKELSTSLLPRRSVHSIRAMGARLNRKQPPELKKTYTREDIQQFGHMAH